MTDASKIEHADPLGLASSGPPTAADSMLSPPNVSEADALRRRIERALTVAKPAHEIASNQHMGGHYVSGSATGKDALAKVVAILEGRL